MGVGHCGVKAGLLIVVGVEDAYVGEAVAGARVIDEEAYCKVAIGEA